MREGKVEWRVRRDCEGVERREERRIDRLSVEI